MRWSFLIETGWCGFGFCGGLIPEARLGIVRLAACRGWLTERTKKEEVALRLAAVALALPVDHFLP